MSAMGFERSQFAQVVKGVDIRSTALKGRMSSNPIADMSGWSHSARKRKLAPSPGLALKSTQVQMVSTPSLTCVGDTRKGRKGSGRPRVPFVSFLSVCLQHMSAMGLRPSAPAWMLKPPQATEQAFFLCTVTPATHVSYGVRTHTHLRAVGKLTAAGK